jgi:hypothetical protein
VLEVLEVEFGDGPDADGRVNEDGDDGPVSEADDFRDVDSAKKIPRLLDADFRRLPLDDLMPLGPD